MLSAEQQLDAEDDEAAGGGDFEEARAVPGERDAREEGERAGYRRLRGGEDGGEGHDGERHVGDVVEEGAQEGVFDLPADEGERHEADGDGHGAHDEQIEIHGVH